MNDSYLTLAQAAEGLYKEKGSKFCAYAFPVDSNQDIKEKIEHIRQQHPTARHVCYAWLMGIDEHTYRANDDGEPSGTAGLPILGQIRSKKLTHVLLLVVRYFGGTKLGVSGLKNAYKTAAREALEQAVVVEKTLQSVFELHFDYSAVNAVMTSLNVMNANILEQHFEQTCRLRFSIRRKEAGKVHSMFSKMVNLELRQINS